MRHDPIPHLSDLVHGVDQEVAGDGLNNVLGEFPSIGLEGAPFASSGDAVVDIAGATELVLTQPRLHIR